MAKPAKYLFVGAAEPWSGKSTTVLGLSYQLQQKKVDIAFGKPLGTSLNGSNRIVIEEDAKFISKSLKLEENRLAPTLLSLDKFSLEKRLSGDDTKNYQQSLVEQYLQASFGDLLLLEAPSDLEEGILFDLSLPQMAEKIDASILLVVRYQSLSSLEKVLDAKQRLGERLIGVVVNDVPSEDIGTVNNLFVPYLEQHSIPVLGTLPKTDLLRCISVRDLVHELQAEVLCCSNRLDLLVETMAIGAMNVNSAVKYFRKRNNTAVVTGGDRVEIQQAALETSTQCLILTGKLPPPAFILNRAEELEIPIISVDLDTLTTVEIIDKTFSQAHIHEPIKAECIRQMMSEHFDIDRLLSLIDLNPATTLS
ncbi:MAG: phosphotransacetylase family protein [Cyanobacteria bacterium J06639_18]